eukprot:gene2828-3121_t
MAQLQSVLQIYHTVLSGNIARKGNGGGLSLEGDAQLELLSLDSRITLNHAGGSGGGVYLLSPMFHAAQITNTTVSNNTAVSLSADVGVIADHLTVVGDGPPALGTLPAGFTMTKVLAYNKSGSNGIVNFNLDFQQPPGTYHLQLFIQDNSQVLPVVVPVTVRSCIRGEVSPSPDTCLLCPPGSFALDSSAQKCQPCPRGALCPGGDVILSLPGWWRSSTSSPQMHR